jgi:hypothetical protein
VLQKKKTDAKADMTYTLIALVRAAAGTSETSANFYRTTQRHNPEDSGLQIRRREDVRCLLCDRTVLCILSWY